MQAITEIGNVYFKLVRDDIKALQMKYLRFAINRYARSYEKNLVTDANKHFILFNEPLGLYVDKILLINEMLCAVQDQIQFGQSDHIV